MSAPTNPPPAAPFQAAWVTCDAPGCGRIGPLADKPWMWDLATQLPPGWRVEEPPTHHSLPYVYCPDHEWES